MDWFEFPIQVVADRCLVIQSPRSTCRRCEQVCPAGAIHLQKRDLELAEEACLGCALCLTCCPTGAWESPDLAWSPWLTRTAAQVQRTTKVRRTRRALSFQGQGQVHPVIHRRRPPAVPGRLLPGNVQRP